MSEMDEDVGFGIEIKDMLQDFLKEDVRTGDITSEYLLPDKWVRGKIESRSHGILAGMEEIKILFRFLNCRMTDSALDGLNIVPGQLITRIEGNVKSVLRGERVALNLLSRMSGIATETNKFVEKVRSIDKNVRIAATRKTTPGFRFFEKKAVRIGGGDPHRYALDDMILIKENHIKICGSIRSAMERIKGNVPFSKKIEIEVESFPQFKEALGYGPDIIMLDNMSPKETEECREHLNEIRPSGCIGPLIEISGNINLGNIRKYAPFADIISVGSLTHSFDSLDFTMLLSTSR